MANTDMVHVTTKTGFEIDVDKACMDDMEIIEALADVEDSKISGLPRMIKLMLGEDGKKALYDHVRKQSKSGRVRVSAISEEIKDITDALGNDAKN